MAVQHAILAQAFGARGDHVLLVDFVEKTVFGQQGKRRKVADYQCRNGKRQVPEIVEDLAR